MTLAVILIALVSLALAAAVAWPLLSRGEELPPDPREDELRELDAAILRSLSAIREIEFDHRAGNITEGDFGDLDADERARAVELIRRRDELRGTTGEAPAGEGGGAPESGAEAPEAAAPAPAPETAPAAKARPAKRKGGA